MGWRAKKGAKQRKRFNAQIARMIRQDMDEAEATDGRGSASGEEARAVRRKVDAPCAAEEEGRRKGEEGRKGEMLFVSGCLSL